MNLHPRFHQPMTPELLDELKAYREILDDVVSMYKRLVDNWPRDGLVIKKVKPKVRRLKSVSV
jgi:hypothetical protein